MPPSASVHELSLELRARGVGTDAFAAAFARARYGPPASAAVAADETRRELRRILSLLRDAARAGEEDPWLPDGALAPQRARRSGTIER